MTDLISTSRVTTDTSFTEALLLGDDGSCEVVRFPRGLDSNGLLASVGPNVDVVFTGYRARFVRHALHHVGGRNDVAMQIVERLGMFTPFDLCGPVVVVGFAVHHNDQIETFLRSFGIGEMS